MKKFIALLRQSSFRPVPSRVVMSRTQQIVFRSGGKEGKYFQLVRFDVPKKIDLAHCFYFSGIFCKSSVQKELISFRHDRNACQAILRRSFPSLSVEKRAALLDDVSLEFSKARPYAISLPEWLCDGRLFMMTTHDPAVLLYTLRTQWESWKHADSRLEGKDLDPFYVLGAYYRFMKNTLSQSRDYYDAIREIRAYVYYELGKLVREAGLSDSGVGASPS